MSVVQRLSAMLIKSYQRDCPVNVWWAFFLELLQLTTSGIGIMCSILFLLAVFGQRDLRQNLSLLLAANLSVGGLWFSIAIVAQDVYMLAGCASDDLCALRAYMILAGIAYVFQSALLQTIQRLFLTVFIHNQRLQNKWLFFGLALTQCSFCLLALLPMLFNNELVYQPPSKMCFMAVNDVFAVMYPAATFYLIPLAFQALLSYWVLRHVSRESRARHNSINAARRIRKERRVLARLGLPVILLLSVGLIYMSYFLASLITHSTWQLPPYGIHLSFVASASAVSITMLANILMQKQVKQKIVAVFLRHTPIPRNRSVHPTALQHLTRTLPPVE